MSEGDGLLLCFSSVCLCDLVLLVELKLIREEAQNGNIFLLFSLMIQRLHYIVLKPGLYMYRIQSILNQH